MLYLAHKYWPEMDLDWGCIQGCHAKSKLGRLQSVSLQAAQSTRRFLRITSFNSAGLLHFNSKASNWTGRLGPLLHVYPGVGVFEGAQPMFGLPLF